MSGRRGLPAKEAAEFCGVALSTFRKYVRQGIIPAATLPGNRWDRKRLEKWMDEQSSIMGSNSSHGSDGDENNPWDVVLSDATNKKRTT